MLSCRRCRKAVTASGARRDDHAAHDVDRMHIDIVGRRGFPSPHPRKEKLWVVYSNSRNVAPQPATTRTSDYK